MSKHAEIERILAEAEQEGYARGFADAIAAMTAAATEAAKTSVVAPTPALTPESAPVAESAAAAPANGNGRGSGRPAKFISLVHEAIVTTPGIRGSEIVRYLEEQGTPVMDRTVRSCLRRLKGKEVWQRSKRWYPKNKADSDGLSGEAASAPLPH